MRRIKKWIKKIKVRSDSGTRNPKMYVLEHSAWRLFPLSFYQTHTQEEIKRITQAAIEKIRSLIDDLEE